MCQCLRPFIILEMLQVLESTAFWSMAFSGTAADVTFPLTVQSYSSVLVILLSCSLGVGFLFGYVGEE